MIDLIRHFRLPVVLVCSEYLGSINHSLLSFYALQREEIPVDFVVLNGIQTESTKSALMAHLQKVLDSSKCLDRRYIAYGHG